MTTKPGKDNFLSQIQFATAFVERIATIMDEHYEMLEDFARIEEILEDLPDDMDELEDIREIVKHALDRVRKDA